MSLKALLILSTLVVSRVWACTVTTSWEAPTLRDDGSPLTNLAGFRVYWGTSPGSYQNSVDVPDPQQLSTDIQVPETLHYFAATAYDADGYESAFSNEVSLVPTRECGDLAPPNPGTITGIRRTSGH